MNWILFFLGLFLINDATKGWTPGHIASGILGLACAGAGLAMILGGAHG